MYNFRNDFFTLCIKIQTMQVIQNDVIKCCKMMSANVVLLHSNNCCVVLEPAICEDLDLHVVIFKIIFDDSQTVMSVVTFAFLLQNFGKVAVTYKNDILSSLTGSAVWVVSILISDEDT